MNDIGAWKGAKKDFRRGGSYPPPEVRHGLKPYHSNLGSPKCSDPGDYTAALQCCQFKAGTLRGFLIHSQDHILQCFI